jgi:hypothetical protein
MKKIQGFILLEKPTPLVTDWEILEEAFAKGIISLDQLFEVMVDNFGYFQAKKIIKKNVKLALKREREHVQEIQKNVHDESVVYKK